MSYETFAQIMASQYRTYKVGDPVIIMGVTSDGEPAEGRVVHIFTLPDWSHEHYVIEIETAMDPLLEVRSGHVLGMSPSKGSMEYDSWAASISDAAGEDEGKK